MLGDRSLFRSLASPCYLNHAAMSPPSDRVREACNAVIADYAAHGAAAWMRHAREREVLRERLARLLNAKPSEIGLVPGTSHAASMIGLSMRWRQNDRLLLLRGEFPANVTPWLAVAQRFGLEVRWLDVADFVTGGPGLERLASEVEAGVALIAVSMVQFQSGMRMPIEAIADVCHARGCLVFVDAIQALGAIPIDVRAAEIDFLAAGSHKWLMGVEGAGVLFVGESAQAELEPAIAGWLSHSEPPRFLFDGAGLLDYRQPLRRRADVFEVGVTNTLGFAALTASTAILEEIGIDAIHRHVQPILDRLEAGLTALGFRSVRSSEPSARSNILSVLPPANLGVSAVANALAAEGVAIATPDGHLRFAPHWPNDLTQADFALAALDRALARLG
jgi:selenocysteine lyase/cysteine desulfurase